MGELLHFPPPGSRKQEDGGTARGEAAEEATQGPLPFGVEPEQRELPAPPAPISAAREQRFRRTVEANAHTVSERAVEELRLDADGWMDDLIPAVLHAHFGDLSFRARWRRRSELRAFRERLERYREPILLNAMERLLGEVQPPELAPSMLQLKERLGRLCFEELEKCVPRELVTAEDIVALRRLGVSAETIRGAEAERERQSGTVRPMRPRERRAPPADDRGDRTPPDVS